jgi:WD40 repeat protein
MTEETIFAAALEKRTSAEREAYLVEACAGDVGLRRRVECLLGSHFSARSFLETPAVERPTEELGRQAEAGETPRDAGGSDENVSLDFLTPSNQPGHLGRLGHYEIEQLIGRGGMGIVLKAMDDILRRVVAIKVMAPQLATSAGARRRFVREAQAAAAIRNDHVIAIHAVEEANELPYIVMEYISGDSLQQRLDRSGPLELREILRIGHQVACGLAAAHAQGLIHRDVKPANILLENGVERVKITDFGLARAVDDASLTQSGVVAGTPYYMSPEQARGEAVDQRSDLFSLGSVLYAMCTGRPPFRASGSMAVLKRVCDEPTGSIREVNPQIPDWLAAIIDQLHEKNPADRFQTATAVADLLGNHLAHLQQPTLAPMPPSPLRGNALGHQAGGKGARSRRWIMAAVVFFCFVGSLSLTEATGVTHLTATVIRILRPDGTLVVEVDDPDIKVTVDADGGLVITGAGPHEIRLHAGSYSLQATKDGKRIKNEVVTISRGDRRVVRVSLEPKSAGQSESKSAPQGQVGFFPHPGASAMDVSSDGRLLLSGGWDHALRLWNLQTRQLIHKFDLKDGVHNNAIYALAIAPNGKEAIAGNREGRVWLWDLRTFKELHHCDNPPWKGIGITSLVYSSDGARALLASNDGVVRVWDVKNWVEVQRLEGPHGLWSVDLSKDDRYVLAGGGYDGGRWIHLWDLKQEQKPRTLEFVGGGSWRAIFSSDHRHALWACSDKTARLMDLEKGTEVRSFIGHTDEVIGVALSPDGRRILTGSRDKTVRVWDTDTAEMLACFDPHVGVGQTNSVAFTPDGKFAFSTDSEGVRRWELPATLPRTSGDRPGSNPAK